MHSPVLVLHPCLYFAPEARKNGVEDNQMFADQVAKYGEEAVYQTIAQNLRVAGDAAQKMGVKIALENGDKFHVLMNSESLPKLVNLTNHPAIGYCLDSGHAHCGGLTAVTDWVHIMGDKLFTTHFHDNRGPRFAPTDGFVSAAGIDEHMPVGFGTIPWMDVIQALWEIGYDRTVNFETDGWPCENGIGYAIQYWRMMEKMAEIKLTGGK